MEYPHERAHLARLAAYAQLAEPDGGIHAAPVVVQALTATGEAFEDALRRIDTAHPQLAEHLPTWYTATRAIGAECVILAQWWTEELGREHLRWTENHDARLAEDIAHFEQLRARAASALVDPQPAMAFETVAMPDVEPWEENLPPRARRWYLAAWPVAAAAALGIAVYGYHSWETGHTAISGVLNGNTGPAGATALPNGSTPTAKPTAASSTTAPSMAPVAAASSTTAQPAPRRTTASAAPTTAGVVPQVIVTLVGADGSPQVEAYITVDATTTAPTTLYLTEYGVTSTGKRTAERLSSQTLSGKTAYAVARIIDTSAWCGDTVTVVAVAGPGTAAAQTSAGC